MDNEYIVSKIIKTRYKQQDKYLNLCTSFAETSSPANTLASCTDLCWLDPSQVAPTLYLPSVI